jgi:Na+/melibiose symporter-like transporter
MNNPQDPAAAPDKEDPFAYRLAVGTIGLALVAFLIGAAIIAAGGKPVPTQYWTTGSSISGALLGILAPTPKSVTTPTARTNPIAKGFAAVSAVLIDLWKNRALLILIVVFGVSLGFGISNNSPELLGVAAAAGGALVGLLAPPPKSTG